MKNDHFAIPFEASAFSDKPTLPFFEESCDLTDSQLAAVGNCQLNGDNPNVGRWGFISSLMKWRQKGIADESLDTAVTDLLIWVEQSTFVATKRHTNVEMLREKWAPDLIGKIRRQHATASSARGTIAPVVELTNA